MFYFRATALGEGGGHLSKGPLSAPDKQGVRAFTDRVAGAGVGRGGCVLQAETAQSSSTVIFKLVIGGLTSIILNVLGTVNLQFQGPFVPISSWSIPS